MSIPPLGVQTRLYGAEPRAYRPCPSCTSGKMHYYMNGYDYIFTPCPNCVSTYRSKELTDLRLKKLEEHTLQINKQIEALEKEIGEVIEINKKVTSSYVKDIANLESQIKIQSNLINNNTKQISEFIFTIKGFKDLFDRYYNVMIFIEKQFGLSLQNEEIKYVKS